MLKKSLETQLGFPPADRFDGYQREIGARPGLTHEEARVEAE